MEGSHKSIKYFITSTKIASIRLMFNNHKFEMVGPIIAGTLPRATISFLKRKKARRILNQTSSNGCLEKILHSLWATMRYSIVCTL